MEKRENKVTFSWSVGKTVTVVMVIVVALILKWFWWVSSAPKGLQYAGT